ncbi:TPA: hypothetical protein NJ342_004675 [Vibrio parahaemolyticus]|nr:hypothetical protein [Vibrio parahaemolyticus]
MKKHLHKPFVLTGFFLLITAILGLFPSMVAGSATGILFSLLIVVTILVFLVPLVFLALNIQNFHGKSLTQLIFLYLEGVVLFGCAYFLLSYLGDTKSHFSGFESITPAILEDSPKKLFSSLFEYIHFSLVTVSTVGFGNVFPKSTEALCLTAAQIMLGLYTVVIGVGSALSILVNQKISAKEESKKIPLRLAAYQDISVFVNRIMGLFVELHRHSVPANAPLEMEEFFTEKQMKAIYGSLDLNGKANITPEKNWWDYLAYEANNICDYGEKILVRHAGHVDPETYNLVHRLSESPEFATMKMLPTIRILPARQNFPSVLSANSVTPSDEFLSNLLKLYSWCHELRKQHSEERPSMRSLFIYNPNQNKTNPPASMYAPAYAVVDE